MITPTGCRSVQRIWRDAANLQNGGYYTKHPLGRTIHWCERKGPRRTDQALRTQIPTHQKNQAVLNCGDNLKEPPLTDSTLPINPDRNMTPSINQHQDT